MAAVAAPPPLSGCGGALSPLPARGGGSLRPRSPSSRGRSGCGGIGGGGRGQIRRLPQPPRLQPARRATVEAKLGGRRASEVGGRGANRRRLLPLLHASRRLPAPLLRGSATGAWIPSSPATSGTAAFPTLSARDGSLRYLRWVWIRWWRRQRADPTAVGGGGGVGDGRRLSSLRRQWWRRVDPATAAGGSAGSGGSGRGRIRSPFFFFFFARVYFFFCGIRHWDQVHEL